MYEFVTIHFISFGKILFCRILCENIFSAKIVNLHNELKNIFIQSNPVA